MDHPTTVDTNLSEIEEPNAYSLQLISVYFVQGSLDCELLSS